MGQQESTTLDFPLTVSLLNPDKEPIFSKPYQISSQQATLEIILDKLPSHAAVDPDYILPSAFLQDNIKRIRSKFKEEI